MRPSVRPREMFSKTTMMNVARQRQEFLRLVLDTRPYEDETNEAEDASWSSISGMMNFPIYHELQQDMVKLLGIDPPLLSVFTYDAFDYRMYFMKLVKEFAWNAHMDLLDVEGRKTMEAIIDEICGRRYSLKREVVHTIGKYAPKEEWDTESCDSSPFAGTTKPITFDLGAPTPVSNAKRSRGKKSRGKASTGRRTTTSVSSAKTDVVTAQQQNDATFSGTSLFLGTPAMENSTSNEQERFENPLAMPITINPFVFEANEVSNESLFGYTSTYIGNHRLCSINSEGVDPGTIQVTQRKMELCKRNVRRGEIYSDFQQYVFKNLSNLNMSDEDALAEIEQRGLGAIRVQKYVPRFSWKRFLIPALENMEPEVEAKIQEDYPHTIFEIFSATYEKHQKAKEERKEIVSHVMNLFGLPIARFIGSSQASQLVGAFPDHPFSTDILDEFVFDRQCTKLWLERQITAKLGHSHWGISGRAIADVTRRAADFPDNVIVGREGAVATLLDIINSSPVKRKAELSAALEAVGLKIRSDSKLCQLYIDADVGYSLAEAVGIMRLTDYLFSFSHRIWSKNKDEFEKSFRDIVFTRQMTWEDAYDEIIECQSVISSEYSESEYDSDYYGGNGRGCWDCGGPDFPCDECGRGYFRRY